MVQSDLNWIAEVVTTITNNLESTKGYQETAQAAAMQITSMIGCQSGERKASLVHLDKIVQGQLLNVHMSVEALQIFLNYYDRPDASIDLSDRARKARCAADFYRQGIVGAAEFARTLAFDPES